MVSVLKRMRKLKTLLNIRVGLGAAILPSASSAPSFAPVTRLHLTYARKIYDGHQGARKFWRECLPRLKFYNPAVPITVKQTEDQKGPAHLTVYFDSTAGGDLSQFKAKPADEFAPAPTDSEKVSIIDVKNKELKDIWAQFKGLTKADEVKISESDKQEMDSLARQEQQSNIDRKRMAQDRERRKDEERKLEEARKAVQGLKEED